MVTHWHKHKVKEPFLKRPLDIILSTFMLIVSLPVSLPIALAIKMKDGGPILYGQERWGRNGNRFKALAGDRLGHTVSVSTTSGEYVLNGTKMVRTTSKLPITINSNVLAAKSVIKRALGRERYQSKTTAFF